MNPFCMSVKSYTDYLFLSFEQFWEVGPVGPSIELSCLSFLEGKELEALRNRGHPASSGEGSRGT